MLVSHHGDEASAKAQERVGALAYSGDTEGVAVWRRIARAINELRRMKPVGALGGVDPHKRLSGPPQACP